MRCQFSLALLGVALVSQVVGAQDKRAAPKGPPPRFITVASVDAVRGKVVFDVPVVDGHSLTGFRVLQYPDGSERYNLGGKPWYIDVQIKVSVKEAKWRGVDGKEVNADAAAKRIKPGLTVLLSADGDDVDPAYLRMFKEDTLVLIEPADELPVPVLALPDAILGHHYKKVGERGGKR